MSSSSIARRSAILAAAAGAAWTTASVLTLIAGGPRDYLDIVIGAPLVLTMAAIASLHQFQGRATGRLGSVGFAVFVVGSPLILLGQAGIIADNDLLKGTALPAGMLLYFGGMFLFGLGTARAGILSWKLGLAIAFSEVLTALTGIAFSPLVGLSSSGAYSGALAHGVIWLAVARALRALAANGQRTAVRTRQYA
jgi:hypothetical protein